MTDWDEIRTHFPALQDRVDLNTAGGGPMCREAYYYNTEDDLETFFEALAPHLD